MKRCELLMIGGSRTSVPRQKMLDTLGITASTESVLELTKDVEFLLKNSRGYLPGNYCSQRDVIPAILTQNVHPVWIGLKTPCLRTDCEFHSNMKLIDTYR